MNCIISWTGHVYSKKEFEEYIEFLGFDVEEAADLLGEQEKLFNEINYLKAICDDWELQIDGYTSNIQNAVLELESVIQKLQSNKGLTKANAAKQIEKIIKEYLEY